MRSILLITHDTSLTGAPKSILLVFEELIKNGYSVTTIALKGGGKLEERFKQMSRSYFRLDDLSKKKVYSIKNRLNQKIFEKPILSEYDNLINDICSIQFDVIYCNTVVSLSIAILFKEKLRCKLILHVHELKTVIDEYYPNLNKKDDAIDLYIVPSELNKICLIDYFDIPKQKIHIIRETSEIGYDTSILKDRSTFNILMCGGAYWRKGDDLFVLIANAILKQDDRFRFYWVGYQSEERERVNRADLGKLGILDFVSFIDETDYPISWYIQSDAFMLTSREDPFPLAAIEAGMLGLPIFCFDQATGISEVINSYCVIPYLDIDIMAKRIIDVFNDRKIYTKLSTENKSLFSNLAPRFISNEIHNLLQ
jgi:glycosyltransferase involved in cell wall biosynthesis